MSTDNSLSIIGEYIAKYPNVIVHTQENKIAGGARNYGILHAKGDYIWFIDGDDWVKEDCLSRLIGFTEDIILFSGYYRYIDGEISAMSAPTPKFNEIAETKMNVLPPLVLYRRMFLLSKSLFHLENVYCEDTEFAPKIYCCAESANYIREEVFYYRLNRNSVSQAMTPKKCGDFLILADYLLLDKEKYSTGKKWDLFFDFYIPQLYTLFYGEALSFLSNKEQPC